MTIKKIIRKIHLFLGLSSGLVVFVIAVTGCLYAFQEEIQNLTQPYRFVTAQSGNYLPPSQMQQIAEKLLPGKHAHSVQYGKSGQAAHVIFYNVEPEYYYTIFVNPYSGEVLKVKDMYKDFFFVVLQGHFYLWLPHEIGQKITIGATMVFVVMMISGLILWWPKNKSAAKQRFTIKWNAAWRRKNYDLHNVLGFYMTWAAIIMALTGLVFGWQWLANTIYHTSGGKKSLTYEEPLSDTTKTASFSSSRIAEGEAGASLRQAPVVDKLWLQMQQEHSDAEIIEAHFPNNSKSAIEMAINTEAGTYWKTDYRYFDQYTMQEIPVQHIYGRFKNASGADKLLRMNYDIHVGAILGFPGKVLAFLASFIAASLPVTGFMIWWGRRKKTSPQPLSFRRGAGVR